MTYEHQGRGALDYFPCRYGKSKILFRGPKRDLAGQYVAVLGGTETYGRFIEEPYPVLVEKAIGCTTVNFGCVNAGIDVFRNEPSIIRACSEAAVTVIQIMGAQNTSNRFYTVHPRRNDRFIAASTLMRTIYREVDFTEFSFNRHMLTSLRALSPERFDVLRDELQAAWVARMRSLIEIIGGQVVLLWFSDRSPGDTSESEGLGSDPLFVDRCMIETLRPYVTAVAEVEASEDGEAHGIDGMVYAPIEVAAAHTMLGIPAHEAAARALKEALSPIV